MQDDEFEWDITKAIANSVKHGVSFEDAAWAFDDPFALEWPDLRYGMEEDRYCLLGETCGQVLFIAFTYRNDRTRIIMARGATAYERRQYHQNR